MQFFSILSSGSDYLCQDDQLKSILEGISSRAGTQGISEGELTTLQSILVKLLSYYKVLEDIIAMVCFSFHFLIIVYSH